LQHYLKGLVLQDLDQVASCGACGCGDASSPSCFLWHLIPSTPKKEQVKSRDRPCEEI